MSATCDDRGEPLTLPSRFIIMIQNKAPIVFSISFAILALAFSCGPRRSANEKRYPLKGKVVAVDKTDRTATIMHEDIPGFMPGMTMPFKIKSDGDLEMLKPGDQVTAQLVVDDLSSWVMVAVRSALSTATTFPLSGYRFSLAERCGPQESPRTKTDVRMTSTR